MYRNNLKTELSFEMGKKELNQDLIKENPNTDEIRLVMRDGELDLADWKAAYGYCPILDGGPQHCRLDDTNMLVRRSGYCGISLRTRQLLQMNNLR